MWHTKNHKNVHSANPSKSSTYIMFGFIMFPFFGLILCLSFISTIDTLMRYSNHVNHKTKIKGDNIIVEFLLYLTKQVIVNSLWIFGEFVLTYNDKKVLFCSFDSKLRNLS